MKTFFYERTAYKLSNEPVPNCFFLLDDHFDTRFTSATEAYTHPSLLLAENICAQMANVEMYAFLIADALRRHGGLSYTGSSTADIDPLLREPAHHDPTAAEEPAADQADDHKAAILMRSFLLGYLGACEALLDSGAIALAQLYRLPLQSKEQRFDNGEFWSQLVRITPTVHRRYHAQRLFFGEVARWRDEAAQRIPPIALLQRRLERSGMQLQIIDEPSENLDTIATEPRALRWIDPLDLHRRWKPRLLNLCERLCRDIQEQT